MHCEKIPLSETGSFSDLFLHYVKQDSSLNGFYNLPPSLKSFPDVIKQKGFDDSMRSLLYQTLTRQYAEYTISGEVQRNIEQLKGKKTFTVTTGHQLNIFTGPMYFIYKILTVINTTELLNRTFPEYHFVPVYWMASEDHDIDEIRSFSLFGKKYRWETDQEGPVGRMNPSSLEEVLKQLPEKAATFEKAYLEHDNLADAVRYYVNELFGTYGLVVVDGDNAQLKAAFKNIMKDDLINHQANDEVESTSAALAAKGFSTQVYPRAINLFYMDKGLRNRLIKEGGMYRVLDTDITFSEEGLLKEVDAHPEKFSPNVILRPMFQEIILPNIAYVGGPAEIAYWLQLRGMFDHYKVTFPILMPRNFAMIISRGFNKKLQKVGLSPEEIFKPIHELKNRYIEEHADYAIGFESEVKILEELFESVRNKAMAVDQSLEGYVEAEKVKVLKILENIGKRLRKSEEQKQSVALRQLESVKEKLFPEGVLQERYDNFLSFALNDPDFIESTKKFLDPFDFRFNILIQD